MREDQRAPVGFHPMSHLFDNLFPSTDSSGRKKAKLCKGCTHFKGKIIGTGSYSDRVTDVISRSKDRIKQSTQCWAQLRCLSSRSDQDEVCAALYKFIFANPCDVTGAKEMVQTALSFCYAKERLGALELVIWKAMCLVQVPPSAVTDLHLWNAWCQRGWKIHKNDVRHASSLAVVMSSVVPFVDQSEEMVHYPTIRQVTASDMAARKTLESPTFRPLDHLCLDVCNDSSRKRDACKVCAKWVWNNVFGDDETFCLLLCLFCCRKQASCRVCAQWKECHKENEEKVTYLVDSCSLFRNRIQELSEHWPLVRQILCGRDQTKVQAAQFRFLLGNLCEEKRTKVAMVRCISKGIARECWNVLTLVVWKALCTTRAPRDTRDIYAWHLWCGDGWKVHKADVWSTMEL
jgi:hypothetical protein